MRNVLITGGTRGIGKAIVEEFYKNGDKVLFLYKNSTKKANEIETIFKGSKGYRCDVSSAEEVEKTFNDILSEYKNIDVLINNAGVSWEGLMSDMTLDEWNHVINSNLTSVFLTCKALTPHFISKKQGKIINISSMWGEVGASCEVAYSASKAGVIGFTKALAKELAPSGITVNAVSPGVIRTDMLSSFTKDDIDALADETPLGRIGEASDVAKAVLFLSKNDADFITGEIIKVNGGFVI
mgnify:CR=1 FL=1